MNIEKVFEKMTECYSHDPKQIHHFLKVHSFAKRIGISEGLDEKTLSILEIAAIVHDIGIKAAREKYGSSAGNYQEELGPAIAKAMLEELNYPQDIIERICYLVGRHHTYTNIEGMDYQILIEADFLVNIYEGNMSQDSVRSLLEKIFKTKMGKWLCETMYF